jgi:hypothetical protein
VTRADTVPFIITMPNLAFVDIQANAPTPGHAASISADLREVSISPGGVVVWFNTAKQPVDLVFEDSAKVAEAPLTCGDGDPGGAGNVAAFGDATGNTEDAVNCRMRRFPVAGVYPYHSTTTGVSGRIVVTDGVPSDP